ncbi:malate/lactate dehydrogenase [Lacticaseibacillus paracasei subsp. paracasei Lpp71]|uniref:Malate/lactate dehydrogenase n=1 Tax=Lacticaseibacillus paracasei subsp. paracasei Lpp71 TaxID=1256207 RepID=A0A8E0IQH1_LACPA|nr:malate/lactate dehydrogenase [Lacticaseibacillus paracasei subsp. paracasei Lpp71]
MSRAYVGATPVLRLLNDQTIFTDGLDAVRSFLRSPLTVLLGRLVIPIIAAYSGDSLIGTLTHLMDVEDDTGQVYSSPVLLNDSGVVTLATVAGSDDEEAALSQTKQTVQDQIKAIEQGASKHET